MKPASSANEAYCVFLRSFLDLSLFLGKIYLSLISISL